MPNYLICGAMWCDDCTNAVMDLYMKTETPITANRISVCVKWYNISLKAQNEQSLLLQLIYIKLKNGKYVYEGFFLEGN